MFTSERLVEGDIYTREELRKKFDIKDATINTGIATAQLRIAEDLGEWADKILQVFDGLPQGISSDGVSVAPTVLRFGSAVALEIED